MAGMRSFTRGRLICHLLSCTLLAIVFVNSSLAETTKGATGSPYPAPGTYKLDRIKRAADGWVIENNVWVPRRLSSFTSGKITLFSFFYGTCRDPQGCPALWSAFESIQSELVKDKELSGRVRLVFLSLDPAVDTPDLLSVYKAKSTPEVPWHFLTTWSNWFLRPIMRSMDLTATYAVDKNGKHTGDIYHMIRVYLIDRGSWIREIYATGFFNTDVVLNDIKTLLMEENSHR